MKERRDGVVESCLYASLVTNFLCMLPMAVARFSSGGVVILYALPVTCFTVTDDVTFAHKSKLLDVVPQLTHMQPWAWL